MLMPLGRACCSLAMFALLLAAEGCFTTCLDTDIPDLARAPISWLLTGAGAGGLGADATGRTPRTVPLPPTVEPPRPTPPRPRVGGKPRPEIGPADPWLGAGAAPLTRLI